MGPQHETRYHEQSEGAKARATQRTGTERLLHQHAGAPIKRAGVLIQAIRIVVLDFVGHHGDELGKHRAPGDEDEWGERESVAPSRLLKKAVSNELGWEGRKNPTKLAYAPFTQSRTAFPAAYAHSAARPFGQELPPGSVVVWRVWLLRFSR